MNRYQDIPLTDVTDIMKKLIEMPIESVSRPMNMNLMEIELRPH